MVGATYGLDEAPDVLVDAPVTELHVRVVLAGLWTALMLIHLLGDVIRIFAGDFEAGLMDGEQASQAVYLAAAAVMLVPIAMIVLSLVLPHPASRRVATIASTLLAGFNLIGLPYPGNYDDVLILVGIVVNGLIIWQSRRWTR